VESAIEAEGDSLDPAFDVRWPFRPVVGTLEGTPGLNSNAHLPAKFEDGDQPPGSPPLLVVLNRDLFFGVKIGNVLRGLGYTVEFAKETDKFVEKMRAGEPSPVLGIIDINAGVDWNVIAEFTRAAAPAVPVLVFGSHLDVDGLRAAKSAGATRVVSNGDFHRDMVRLVERYARRPG
jgi:hypothetical protein